MHNSVQDTVLGGIIKHVQDKKMVIVLGESGDGKTITLLDFCSLNPIPSYYYRCSPNTTMNSLLIFIANALGIRIVGGNDELQNRIQCKLQEDPNYCFVFDEAEYLAYGNCTKIDVLRQIYDETDVPIIICGTYVLKDLISGERKKNKTITHNRPQIFRRLRKEEFTQIDEGEIYNYITEFEQQYAVEFDNRVKTELVSRCRDRQSGSLSNFIELIELVLPEARPEWEAISYQIIKESGRILHNHNEKAQSFTSIKPEKQSSQDEFTDVNEDLQKTPQGVTQAYPYVDVSKLEKKHIDYTIFKDCINHKMTM